MKVYPRSLWTANLPRPAVLGDEFIGLDYFDTPPVGIQFCRPSEDVLYVYRNPINELERLRAISVQGTGFSDINYHYAISQVTEGCYVLRGGITKCMKSEHIRVLMLIGVNEQPTDLLKQNQDNFIKEEVSNTYPISPLSSGDANVHVFNLIEFLAERGLYQARNDGVYGPLTHHAVRRLQKELGVTNLSGEYDLWTIHALDNISQQYIPLASTSSQSAL